MFSLKKQLCITASTAVIDFQRLSLTVTPSYNQVDLLKLNLRN